MIEIDGKIVSRDIFEKKFVCDLSACKGACCVEGDSGAPLTQEEAFTIEESIEEIKPYMTQKGLDALEVEGAYTLDWENDVVTPLVKGKECAYTYFEKDGTAKCSIEKAHSEGKISLKKPISCHLYPIRTKTFEEAGLEALNYDRWSICKPACDCGANLNVKVYHFLKEPLIRKYGEEFYKELEKVDKVMANSDH